MRWIMVLCFGALVAACSPRAVLEDEVTPMGDFRLGFAVIKVLDDVAQGPLSRDVTAEEWDGALQQAFDQRFSRFQGERPYHLGVILTGYVVAKGGVPLVFSPKSILIYDLVVIDNDTGQPLNVPSEQIRIVESLTGGNFLGSGLTSTKEEQMEDLATRAAEAAEDWMRAQPWFYETQAEHEAALAALGQAAQ